MSQQYTNNPLSRNNTTLFQDIVGSGGGGGGATLDNTYPPTSTLTSTAPTTNVARQLYNAIPALTDLAADTVPTSTSTTTAATANSVTKAYNKATSLIPALTDLAISTAPTSNSTTTASTANALTNAYNYILNNFVGIGGALSDETATAFAATTNTLSPTNTITIQLPYALKISNINQIVFSLSTAANAVITLDVVYGSTVATATTSIFSSRPTIANAATTSSGGAVNSVTIPKGSYIRAAVYNVAANNAARGLKFYILNSA